MQPGHVIPCDTLRAPVDAPALCVVAASFTVAPLQEPLQRALAGHAPACQVELAQYADLPRFLLAPDDLFGARRVLASVVLLRVEDWLRAAGAHADEHASRQRLLDARLDETVAQLALASERGPVLVTCCPSRGSVARRTHTATLCHTLTGVLSARLRATTCAVLLPWSAFEAIHAGSFVFDDPGADRLGQVPFTQPCFDAWAAHLARPVAALLRAATTPPPPTDTGGALEAYLASLEVRVSLSPESAPDRADAERLLATVGAFRSTRLVPEARAEGESHERWIVRMNDRTGDYGTCGLLVLRHAAHVLLIDALLLSCPVLGKRVEHALVTGLLRIASARQCTTLRFAFEPDTANAIVARFFDSFATPDGDAGARAYTCGVADAQRALHALAGSAAARCDVAELPRT